MNTQDCTMWGDILRYWMKIDPLLANWDSVMANAFFIYFCSTYLYLVPGHQVSYHGFSINIHEQFLYFLSFVVELCWMCMIKRNHSLNMHKGLSSVLGKPFCRHATTAQCGAYNRYDVCFMYVSIFIWSSSFVNLVNLWSYLWYHLAVEVDLFWSWNIYFMFMKTSCACK